MDNIKDFVSSILMGNNTQAKELFGNLASERAMERLAERKQEIAQNLFQTEETIHEEQIDELSADTLEKYKKRAGVDYARKRLDNDEVGAEKRRKGYKLAKTKLNDPRERDDIDVVESVELDERAVSQQQQKFMGMVYAAKKGMEPASSEVAKAAAGMTTKQAKDYAATKHEGLPKKVKQD